MTMKNWAKNARLMQVFCQLAVFFAFLHGYAVMMDHC
jgi:hypothetical protein